MLQELVNIFNRALAQCSLKLLATEFGDDFGGTLVGLAETMDSEQLGLLLEKVANIRQ